MTVLDLSNYDANTFDPVCMKTAGVEGIILGCQRIGIAYSMAQKARDAGLPILGTYAYLYFAAAPSATHDAIIVAKAYGVPRVWLDVEDTSGNLPPLADRIQEVANCVQAVEDAGLQGGIYTGGWYWPDKMGNTTEFARLPLWHSAYLNGEGTPYEVRTVNYGGWTDVAVHQWTSTLDVCGRKRDANHYYLEEEMTPEERAKLDAVYAALTGGVAGVIEAWNANGNSVLVAYNETVFPHVNAPAVSHRHHIDLDPFTTGGPIP